MTFDDKEFGMDIDASLKEADHLISEINALRPIDAAQEARVLAKLRLDWNFNSNAIEGNTLSYGETKAFLLHGITAKGKPFKDYLDIKGHDLVLDWLADLVRNKEELTEALIREIHKILMVEPYVERSVGPDGVPMSRRVEIGQYKTAPNHVRTSTGQIHFFASPEETASQMAELIHWYRQEREKHALHPLALAAIFHHTFVAIHPFDDGNGRMARILTNFILMRAGYLPVILKAERRNDYFLALAKADAGETADFVAFVAEAEIESASLFLRAAKGEPIDELGDFDKKLRLLAQSMSTGTDLAGPHLTQEAQNDIVRDFIVPLFKSVGDRFVHFETLFGQRDLSLMWSSKGQAYGGSGTNSLTAKLEQLESKTQQLMVDNVYLQYHGRAFVRNPGKDFFCRIEAFFHPKKMSVTCNVTGKHVGEVFSADYSALPAQVEAEELAKTILGEIVQSVETMAKGN